MKYLGQKVDEFYDGYTWDHGGYVMCPPDTADKQLECLHYEPVDAIDWMCRFCDGDHCKVPQIDSVPANDYDQWAGSWEVKRAEAKEQWNDTNEITPTARR